MEILVSTILPAFSLSTQLTIPDHSVGHPMFSSGIYLRYSRRSRAAGGIKTSAQPGGHMATDVNTASVKTETKARSFGENIESDLAPKFIRVVENAAVACARTMGRGERELSDKVAVESMRRTMDTVPMRGRIVIGEGERDEAPMLYIGEKVGGGFGVGEEVAESCPEVDIAVDPLEGTNLCALGANNAIAVLAAAERGGLLNAPDIY